MHVLTQSELRFTGVLAASAIVETHKKSRSQGVFRTWLFLRILIMRAAATCWSRTRSPAPSRRILSGHQVPVPSV